MSRCWDVDVLDFVGLGLIEEDRDSTAVSGVNWVFEDFDAASPFCRAEELNTEDVVLAWELAEPTVLRISPWTDSPSSVAGCAISDIEPSLRERDAAPSSG